MQKRRTALDGALQRFQHRWETDRRFRSTWSGLLALCAVLVLCSCVGIVGSVATNALAAAGFAGATSSGPTAPNPAATSNGTVAKDEFPTPTSTPGNPGQIPPAGTIPPSLTPLPSPTLAPTPTAPPTATPCQSGCGGPGISVTVSATPQPGVWQAGKPVQLIITVKKKDGTPVTGANVALIYQFPGGGTVLDENGSNATDGNGQYTSNETVPAGTTAGQADIDIIISINNTKVSDTHVQVPCL